ncbi:MAG TPA: AbrB/MazE/SpoVT family DNA-binding domain-containing protein [Acidimicrobiales bacterium]
MATVGAKGQIVIPAEARRELQLEEGDKVVILRGRTKKTLVLLTHPEMDRLIGKLGLTDEAL